MATLMSNISFEGFGLGSLTPNRKSSEAILLASSAAILTSPWLGPAGLVATRIKSDITPALWMKINSSVDLTLVSHSQEEYDMTSFITRSLMTVPSTLVLGLSVGNHKSLAVSAIDNSLVISSLPGANTELKCSSLYSPRFCTTRIVTRIVSVSSRLPLDDGREQSAVFLPSTSKAWILLKPSASFVFLSKETLSANVDFFSSSVIPETKRQTSIAHGYLDISVTSFKQEFTDHKLQPASYLSKLNQIHPTSTITNMELSNEFSDKIWHTKESTFYETFWMNSMILTSWYTLMQSTAVTSRWSFVLAYEITLSMKFMELSSSFPTGRSRDNLFTEDYVFTRSLQEPNTEILCFYTNCATTLPLEPSFSSITASQKMNIYLTTKLTDVEQITTMDILDLLDYSPVGPIKEIPQLKTQVRALHASDTIQEQNDIHILSHSEESTTQVKVSLETFLDLQLESSSVSQTDSVADVLDRHLSPAVYVDITSTSVLAGQSLPSETHFVKTSLPQHLQFPDEYHVESSAQNMAGSESQKPQKWAHGTDELEEDLTASISISLSQTHRLSTVASTISPCQLAFTGEFLTSVNFML